jgi:hypothetical protein
MQLQIKTVCFGEVTASSRLFVWVKILPTSSIGRPIIDSSFFTLAGLAPSVSHLVMATTYRQLAACMWAAACA